MNTENTETMPFISRASFEIVPAEARGDWPKIPHSATLGEFADIFSEADWECAKHDLADMRPEKTLAMAFVIALDTVGLAWDELESEAYRRAVAALGTDADGLPSALAGQMRSVALNTALESLKDEKHPAFEYFEACDAQMRALFGHWREAWQSGTEGKKKAAESEGRADFFIQTSQEIDALARARCDGKRLTNYVSNQQASVITYERKDLAHRVQLTLTPDEIDAGLSLAYLEKLIRAQDSDAALAQLYIMSVLAPPAPLPPRSFAGGWIDFDDVIEKIGWYPQTTKERREMHDKVWGFIRYGERAHVIGKRTGIYKDPATREEIPTEIHGAAWRVHKTEAPAQASLYPALDVPVRAQIVMSQELTALITAPKTAQYLPLGEVLGAIPGGKPAGAWARVIGLVLASLWRRNPREFLSGAIKPTRRELLDRYAAKVAPYQEVLASDKPGRAIEYWCAAMGILADQGFIMREAEAAITPQEMRKSLPRQGWQDVWLNQTVTIEPGAATMKPAIEDRAQALPTLKSHDLKKKPRAKKQTESR